MRVHGAVMACGTCMGAFIPCLHPKKPIYLSRHVRITGRADIWKIWCWLFFEEIDELLRPQSYEMISQLAPRLNERNMLIIVLPDLNITLQALHSKEFCMML